MNVEKDVTFEKITSGQMGADMLTKHATVGVVRYTRSLLGWNDVMERFSVLGNHFFVFDDDTCWIFLVDWLSRVSLI